MYVFSFQANLRFTSCQSEIKLAWEIQDTHLVLQLALCESRYLHVRFLSSWLLRFIWVLRFFWLCEIDHTKACASIGDKTRAITFRILPLLRCNELLIFLLPCYIVYLLRTYLFMPQMRSLLRIKIILCQRCRCTFKQ